MPLQTLTAEVPHSLGYVQVQPQNALKTEEVWRKVLGLNIHTGSPRNNVQAPYQYYEAYKAPFSLLFNPRPSSLIFSCTPTSSPAQTPKSCSHRASPYSLFPPPTLCITDGHPPSPSNPHTIHNYISLAYTNWNEDVHRSVVGNTHNTSTTGGMNWICRRYKYFILLAIHHSDCSI